MSYKIWPTAAGYCVIDSESNDAVTDSMDKRAAMRTAHEYNVNGVPSTKPPKAEEEATEKTVKQPKATPKKRGRKKAE